MIVALLIVYVSDLCGIAVVIAIPCFLCGSIYLVAGIAGLLKGGLRNRGKSNHKIKSHPLV